MKNYEEPKMDIIIFKDNRILTADEGEAIDNPFINIDSNQDISLIDNY